MEQERARREECGDGEVFSPSCAQEGGAREGERRSLSFQRL